MGESHPLKPQWNSYRSSPLLDKYPPIASPDSNSTNSFLGYFQYQLNTDGPPSYFTEGIEALKRKWMLSKMGDEAKARVDAEKSRVIILVKDLPYKVSLAPEWLNIVRRAFEDEELKAVSRQYSVKTDGNNTVTNAASECNSNLSSEEPEEVRRFLESSSSLYEKNEVLHQDDEMFKNVLDPKAIQKCYDGIRVTSEMKDVTNNKFDDFFEKREAPKSAAKDAEMYSNSTHNNGGDVGGKPPIFTILEDDFGLNIAKFIPPEFEVVTIGSAGIHLEQSMKKQYLEYLENALNEALLKKKCVPVFLDEAERKETYSEQLLSFLFHYRTPPLGTGFPELDWPGYVKLNEKFFNTLKNVYKEGDTVLVIDYHLMLIPKMLREVDSVSKIGFYFKSLFPSSEMCRILPHREKLLRGVLSANMVGFQEFQYKRHFLTACTRILGVECSARGIEPCPETGGTGSRVDCISCGVDTDRWLREVNQPEFLKRLEELKAKFGKRKIVIGIDTLDYVRGIPHKIMAFHQFLANDPSWASKLLFLQIALVKGFDESSSEVSVFSHLGADEHDILSNVYQACGAMNAEFGSFDALPVHFLLANLSLEELAPLYACADVAIVTSLRESLSYTSYEFTLCQSKGNKGVLILSEFSGSAQSLGAAALCVNPWDTHAFSRAIHDALIMSENEKIVRHEYAYNYVMKHDAKAWGVNLMSDLQIAVKDLENERLNIPVQLDADTVIQACEKSIHKFIILGLRGCLFPQRHMPIEAELFRFENLDNETQSALIAINEDPNTTVFVASSASTETVERAIGNLSNFYLFAENGHFVRTPFSDKFVPELIGIDTSWLEGVVNVFQYFVQRTPGSFIHTTQTAVSWHYENTHRDHGAMQARDLLMHLWAGPMRAKSQANIAVGSGSVEVRASNLSKSSCVEKYMKEVLSSLSCAPQDCAFLCIGNFLPRDEDIFQVLQKAATHGTVGSKSNLYAAASSAAAPPSTKVELTTSRSSSQPSRLNSSINSQIPAMLSEDIEWLQECKEPTEEVHRPQAASPLRSISNVITCTVGRKQSRAGFHLASQDDVGGLLKAYAKHFSESQPTVRTVDSLFINPPFNKEEKRV